MTPQAALQSDIFRNYALIVAGVLVAAGFALALLKWVFKKEVTSIWLTYRSWLVMSPLIFGCIFGGRAVVIVFICLLAGLGFKEFPPPTRLFRGWWVTGPVFFGLLAVATTSPV